jgi:hypothetical protein
MTQKETQRSKEAKTDVKVDPKPEFVILKSGVMMLGEELMGAKMAAIVAETINLHVDHGLACIVARTDGYPADAEGQVLGMTYADTYSASINLQCCWDWACKKAMEGEENLSLLAMVWINVMSAVGHELDHLDMATKNRDMYESDRATKDGNALIEEVANEAALKTIVQLAKRFDIEIPPAGEMGWFGVKVMELFTNDDTKDLPWVIKARQNMEGGIIYEEGENRCFTLREFIKMAHSELDDTRGDGLWEQPTTAVNLVAHLDSGAVEEFKAEPVIEPQTNTVDLEESEVAEVMSASEAGVEQTPMEALAAANPTLPAINMVKVPTTTVPEGQFVDAGVAAAAVDENDVVFTDQAETVQVAAGETMGAMPDVQLNNAAGVNQAEANTMTVPLPPTVAAQQQVLVAGAATAVPPAQPTPTTYTPNSLAPETMAAVMKSVWQTLYHHVFTKCGWQQNPQTGRFMFTNATAILEGVNIQHILTQFGADNFIMEYDTMSAEGQFAPEMCQGMIRGRTTSQAGLPSYSLYLNINGQRIKRTFMPQNPEKRNASNAYTKSADEAGSGHMIVWVFKDEAADNAPFKEKVAVTIKDNVYEVM